MKMVAVVLINWYVLSSGVLSVGNEVPSALKWLILLLLVSMSIVAFIANFEAINIGYQKFKSHIKSLLNGWCV